MDTTTARSLIEDEATGSRALDTSRAFQMVRQALATIESLQPEDGEYRATAHGPTLVVRHADGTGTTAQFQHVTGGTVRVVTRTTDMANLRVSNDTVTPFTTLNHLTDYLRALVVETLR